MSKETSGKRDHQKIKPYIVLEYLMKYSDEGHALPASSIVDYLKEDCQIDAERRSIYRDIDEINKVLYMLENECSIQEAEEVIDSEDGEEEKFIVYDKNKKGFYVRQRKYDANDIRLLAECVYSARFIDEKRAKRLAKLTGSFVSQWQVEDILHDAFLVDRTKTSNIAVYYSVDRMKEVTPTGQPRDGEEDFRNLDLTNYTQRVFGMFGGKKRRLTIRFINPLLDTAIYRFGTKGVSYSKLDETHFTVTADVEISEQFFSWICGFGNKAKILSPDFVVDEFSEYLDKIRGMY